MEVRVLQYFLAVAREESITRAANTLHITQPTLSRQLAQLEEETGVRLLRGTRKITLTNEGILLRRRAEEIIELVDKTQKELAQQDELVEGTVSIGCGEVAAVQLLPEIIADFHKKYPMVNFDLYTANADQIKERMDDGMTDVGLLLEPIDMDKYDFIRLSVKERWVAVMSADDPLAGQEHITAKELAELPIIMARRQGVRNELANWFGEYYKKLHVLFTSNMSTNAAIMVRGGLGYALVVEGSLPYVDETKICCRPLYPELEATTVLAWKRQQPFGLAATKFIEHMKCFLSMKTRH